MLHMFNKQGETHQSFKFVKENKKLNGCSLHMNFLSHEFNNYPYSVSSDEDSIGI